MSGDPVPGNDRARRSSTARARFARWARAGSALLAVLLAACISDEREQQIGDQVAAHINGTVPMVRDPVLTTYVNRLGRLIARESGRPGVPYRFYIVNSPGVNAFAIPGGHIYINRGLIERTRNVSELSAVLAHEIGHVAARHGARTLERRLRTGSLASLLYRVILGHEPSLLDQSALRMGSAMWTASHSREAELQADELAVKYLVEAGVDPRGMVTFLNGLLKEEASTSRPPLEWFSTHPMTADRIARTKGEIADELPDPSPPLARDIASYPQFLKRLRELPPPPMLLPIPDR